jgi:molybdate transport system permease protein
MDWPAFWLSLELAGLTVLALLPLAVLLGAWLGAPPTPVRPRWPRALASALVLLPLVLPPTVLGFYLLLAFAPASPLGQLWQGLTGGRLVFSFTGVLLASIVVNLPFAVQPAQRGFAAIPASLRDAAALCGMAPWQRFWRVELPLAWPGLVSGLVLAFAHTLGEFGVVLMVGGAIPGQTQTLALSLYDRVQVLDMAGAGKEAGALLAISTAAVLASFWLERRHG